MNFPKIKADIVVDLDKFTIFTMTEIRNASQMKSASSAIAPEAQELQKIMKNHTSYEKKIAFKIVNSLKPSAASNKKASSSTAKPGAISSAMDMAKFNYRGADEEDINGLVDRDETGENELRTVVMSYLQKLFCQMALAKKVIEDFNRVYAPIAAN